MRNSAPTAVYRCFADDGTLLYVGCSPFPLSRAYEHCQLKPWAYRMSRIDVRWFPSKDEARAAERRAIFNEGPEWNVHHAKNPAPGRTRGIVSVTDHIVSNGLSRDQICREAGISRTLLSMIESGGRRPGQNTVARLAKALGVTVRDLRPDLADLFAGQS